MGFGGSADYTGTIGRYIYRSPASDALQLLPTSMDTLYKLYTLYTLYTVSILVSLTFKLEGAIRFGDGSGCD